MGKLSVLNFKVIRKFVKPRMDKDLNFRKVLLERKLYVTFFLKNKTEKCLNM